MTLTNSARPSRRRGARRVELLTSNDPTGVSVCETSRDDFDCSHTGKTLGELQAINGLSSYPRRQHGLLRVVLGKSLAKVRYI